MKTDESRLKGHSCHHYDSNSSSGKVCFDAHVALFTNGLGSRFQENRSIGTVRNLCRRTIIIEICDEAQLQVVDRRTF